jgi:hypothetical protein
MFPCPLVLSSAQEHTLTTYGPKESVSLITLILPERCTDQGYETMVSIPNAQAAIWSFRLPIQISKSLLLVSWFFQTAAAGGSLDVPPFPVNTRFYDFLSFFVGD